MTVFNIVHYDLDDFNAVERKYSNMNSDDLADYLEAIAKECFEYTFPGDKDRTDNGKDYYNYDLHCALFAAADRLRYYKDN